MKFALVYITNPNVKEAQKIGLHLLKKKLIACANIFGPTESFYRWRDKIVREKEFILLLKTAEKNFGKIKTEVEKIHSYSVPCIIKIPAVPNKKYFDWAKKEIK